jgi:hypothetical protein
MLRGLGADGSHLCGVTDAFGEREAEEIGRFARKLIDKSNAKRAASGSTGAPEQEDREKLWALFAMKAGWVEPSAFADDVLKALGRA